MYTTGSVLVLTLLTANNGISASVLQKDINVREAREHLEPLASNDHETLVPSKLLGIFFSLPEFIT